MTAIRMMLLFTALCGVVYPLAMTMCSRLLLPHQASGSLVVVDGKVRGSELIGQHYSDPRYFWGRPSATPSRPYNAAISSGSNLGPNNPDLAQAMEERRQALLAADSGIRAEVPLDLLTASGSGLDPHISPEAAEYQVARVARLRGLDTRRIRELVQRHTKPRQFGMLGEPVVNVLLLNQDLDRQ